MTDTMAGNISKGRIIRLLDAVLYKGEDVTSIIANLSGGVMRISDVIDDAVDDALKPGGRLKLLNAAASNYNHLHKRERDHIDNHWFGDKTNLPEASSGRSYWPMIEDREEIVREAYLEALKMSIDANSILTRSIVTYWLCAGSHFEVAVCNDSPTPLAGAVKDQITMLLLTPSIAWRYLGGRRGLGASSRNPDNPDASLTNNEEIHVYAENSRVTKVVAEASMPILRRALPAAVAANAAAAAVAARHDTIPTLATTKLTGGAAMQGTVARYQVLGDKDKFTP